MMTDERIKELEIIRLRKAVEGYEARYEKLVVEGEGTSDMLHAHLILDCLKHTKEELETLETESADELAKTLDV